MSRDMYLVGLCMRLHWLDPMVRDLFPILLARIAGGPVANDVTAWGA